MNRQLANPDGAAELARRAALFRRVFAVNVDGREVLTLLEKRFAQPPVLTGTQDAVLLTYVRAAQREVLDWIHTQIAIAERGSPPNTPEADTAA